MATAKKKPVVEVEVDEDEELEELEDELDELEALADEEDDEIEADDDEDEDDEEDAPKKRTKKSTKTKEKPAKKKRESTIYGTAELAEDLETDGKNLRVMLRDIGANAVKSKKAPHGSFNEAGRYEWEDLDDALEVLGFDSVEDAIERLKEARNTRLDALKERNADKKKPATKKTSKKAPVEDDDEEEDEDEDEEPAPKKRPRKTSK